MQPTIRMHHTASEKNDSPGKYDDKKSSYNNCNRGIMYFYCSIFPVAVISLAPLLFLLVKPMAAQAAAPYSVSADKSQTIWTRDGLEGNSFFIKRPAMGVALTYEYKDESRTTSGSTAKDSYHRFKERVGFKTDGWLYHPALMQYSLLFEPEWIQSREHRDPGETAKIVSFSPDYALTASFLQQKPYTVDLFASRLEYPIWAAFSGSTESITETYGSTVRLKYEILPATFGYTHTETEQSGYYNSQNIRDDYHLTARHQNPRGNTTLTSTYSEDQRTTQGITTRINTFNNSLTNNHQLTDDKRVNLNSFLSYRAQQNESLDTENFRLKELLNWRHKKNLRSNYSFIYDRQQSGETHTDKTSLGANLTHLLYENLTTEVGSGVDLYNYSDGEENAFNTHLDFAYSRPIPQGTLNLNMGWNYTYTARSGADTSVTQVTNEPHTMGPAQETYLDNYNVDPNSIIVTNTPGTIVYIENIDYTVDVTGDFTRIHYLPFGAITAGQQVMISYRYLRDSAYDDGLLTETYGFNTTLFHDWQLSYNYIRSKQNILSGQAPDNQIDDSVHRARIRYNIRWSDTALNFEDNNRQSSRAYTRWEILETLNYRPTWHMYLAVKGYLGQTSYKDNDEVKDFYGVVTTFDWLLARWCKFHLEGYYSSIRGDLEQTTNSGAKAGFEFRYRIWKARLSYDYTNQNNLSTEYRRREQLFRFEIIRITW